MGEEIKLEAVTQHLVRNLADRPRPGGAGVGNDDIDAAVLFHHLVEGAPDGTAVGDVAGESQPTEFRRHRQCRLFVLVKHRHFGAFGGQGPRRRSTNAGATTGDNRDMAG